MPRPKKDPGLMIYVSAPWCDWVDALAKAVNNTTDVEVALATIEKIREKLLQIKEV